MPNQGPSSAGVLPPVACSFTLRFVSKRLTLMDKSFDSQTVHHFNFLLIVFASCKLFSQHYVMSTVGGVINLTQASAFSSKKKVLSFFV
jgi:hypothetical protein